VKVQLLWISLESVFLGGDIAKQMPIEAKKFAKINKDWEKLMSRAAETKLVLQCCSNELLKTTLPFLYGELEKCQKSLEGYLEQKRSKFPRFYFVSNPVLLLILSQGSDPQQMQPYYEKVFDSIDKVVHSKSDRTQILTIQSTIGTFDCWRALIGTEPSDFSLRHVDTMNLESFKSIAIVNSISHGYCALD
jgi:dynein heavy chain